MAGSNLKHEAAGLLLVVDSVRGLVRKGRPDQIRPKE